MQPGGATPTDYRARRFLAMLRRRRAAPVARRLRRLRGAEVRRAGTAALRAGRIHAGRSARRWPPSSGYVNLDHLDARTGADEPGAFARDADRVVERRCGDDHVSADELLHFDEGAIGGGLREGD